ncbi:MAG: YeeE/YedE thiosulfate transporter family protein [Pseudomonadota bacterium]|nr:YeeE/YedE family protein [Sphingobium naphthae]MEC7933104.1 YeeE/YedE thiosulfate transporter family protein [Pseudomonadota bacterium]MEC8034495.1 YeeE/YedE thiosulfate transporter family protein [Pseudomonadota bacterium]|tara:strand:- start:926 stop:1375 length:450 start_codon:yes stop_codon:yes gene_type:complete
MTLPGFPDAMPVAGLAGGLLIGLAAVIMLLGLGRIAGVSGMLARASGIANMGAPRAVALAFAFGLPLGALLVTLVSSEAAPRFTGSTPQLVIAGLLVGFGTRLGSGCTSGHGVCGLSRLSRRSMVATLTFMASGFATVGLMRAFGFING